MASRARFSVEAYRLPPLAGLVLAGSSPAPHGRSVTTYVNSCAVFLYLGGNNCRARNSSHMLPASLYLGRSKWSCRTGLR